MKKLAQDWGNVDPPANWSGDLTSLQSILNIATGTLIMFAGLYAVINIILAGYGFLSASGDPKRISDATSKIWQSLLGFIIAAGAIVLAGVIGEIMYGDPTALIQLKFFSNN